MGGKYLKVLPPTIALSRNRAKQVSEKKTARKEFPLWKLALAFVVGRGCVPAVSRRGCCHPSWAPGSLPCSSPAGEITKEIINSRQPWAGSLQAGLAQPMLPQWQQASAPIGLPQAWWPCHPALPLTCLFVDSPGALYSYSPWAGDKRHSAVLHSSPGAFTDPKWKGFANWKDEWLLDLSYPYASYHPLFQDLPAGMSGSCRHCSFVRWAASTETRWMKNAANGTHFGSTWGLQTHPCRDSLGTW